LLSLFTFVPPAFAQADARKFAEVGEIPCDDVKSYLDQLSVELQNDRTARAYIIYYGGKSYRNNIWNERRREYVAKRLLPKRGEAEARVSFWKPYLMKTRSVEGSRIEVINGGYRVNPVVEIWIVPTGVKPPRPAPTLKEVDIKFRRGRAKWKEMFGEGCG
jgi:hypothetical protein